MPHTGMLGIVAQRGTKTISTSDISAKTTVELDTEGYVGNSAEYVFVWVMICALLKKAFLDYLCMSLKL